MKIAIIHSGDVSFVARLMNVFPSEGYDIETFDPAHGDLLKIIEEISDFDPDVVILEHEFDNFTGEDLAVTSLSFPPEICFGLSNDPSQKDYCNNIIDPSLNFEDQMIREAILKLINKAASV
mgnify:CR=1 FL=1